MDKATRVLTLFTRLINGDIIKKSDFSEISNVGEKSVEEDETGNNLEEEAINIAPQYMYTNISDEKVEKPMTQASTLILVLLIQ
ncbi:TPA: hypothetical protein ACONOZ_002666 [Staphylococcus aureus]